MSNISYEQFKQSHFKHDNIKTSNTNLNLNPKKNNRRNMKKYAKKKRTDDDYDYDYKCLSMTNLINNNPGSYPYTTNMDDNYVNFDCINFTPTLPINVITYETKRYQQVVTLYYSSEVTQAKHQSITVLVPVSDSHTIPVSISHYIISFSDYMMQHNYTVTSNDMVCRSTKYTTQFGVDDVYLHKKQIWNVEITVVDVYSEKPVCYLQDDK